MNTNEDLKKKYNYGLAVYMTDSVYQEEDVTRELGKALSTKVEVDNTNSSFRSLLLQWTNTSYRFVQDRPVQTYL